LNGSRRRGAADVLLELTVDFLGRKLAATAPAATASTAPIAATTTFVVLGISSVDVALEFFVDICLPVVSPTTAIPSIESPP
jgi:hypothetical protein